MQHPKKRLPGTCYGCGFMASIVALDPYCNSGYYFCESCYNKIPWGEIEKKRTKGKQAFKGLVLEDARKCTEDEE